MGVMPCFYDELLNVLHDVGRCAPKSPIKKRANVLKESSKKNSLKLNAASHNASWYIDTGWFLEPSPGGRGRSLYYKELAFQKIIPFSFGSPLI